MIDTSYIGSNGELSLSALEQPLIKNSNIKSFNKTSPLKRIKERHKTTSLMINLKNQPSDVSLFSLSQLSGNLISNQHSCKSNPYNTVKIPSNASEINIKKWIDPKRIKYNSSFQKSSVI